METFDPGTDYGQVIEKGQRTIRAAHVAIVAVMSLAAGLGLGSVLSDNSGCAKAAKAADTLRIVEVASAKSAALGYGEMFDKRVHEAQKAFEATKAVCSVLG